ncbi:hypothetical protein [Salipiger mangrovisoli]|uniref:hypothetical protein n=1 Tax=Salipiger mangrovisoli TaxID=2865933 RepID=UPI0018808F90|nr:hypothetical protein [Salipiger mangrovisoli]
MTPLLGQWKVTDPVRCAGQDLVSLAIAPVPRNGWRRSTLCGSIGHDLEFRTLADDHPDLGHSSLLRSALLTFQFAQEHGSIDFTNIKAFKRAFFRSQFAFNRYDLPHGEPGLITADRSR